MPHYKITRRGASHRRKEGEGENRVFRTYGYGDTIFLTQEQHDSGKYRHLALVHTASPGRSGEMSATDIRKVGGAFKAQDVVDSPRAAPIGDGSGQTDPQNDVQSEKDDAADDSGNDAKLTDEQRGQIEALRDEVEAVNSKPTLDAARAKVIESGVLGAADDVPTKKVDILKALEAKLGTEE